MENSYSFEEFLEKVNELAQENIVSFTGTTYWADFWEEGYSPEDALEEFMEEDGE